MRNRFSCDGVLSRAAWQKAMAVFGFLLFVNSGIAWAQTKSLIIAVEDDAAPWSLADGTGYANDVVVAAFRAVGVDVQLRVMPYARCKRMAISGDVVACLS